MKALFFALLAFTLAGCGQKAGTPKESIRSDTKASSESVGSEKTNIQSELTPIDWGKIKGKTKDELITLLGNPIEVERRASPDGPYEMLHFDKTKGHEVFFIIFDSDGRVSGGYCNGKFQS